MTSIFLPVGTPLFEIFWTKITATSIIVGLLTSIYGHFSKSKLQVFVISIFIGMIVFIIPILIPVKEDIETLKKRAQKERVKAWSKGKSSLPNEEE